MDKPLSNREVGQFIALLYVGQNKYRAGLDAIQALFRFIEIERLFRVQS